MAYGITQQHFFLYRQMMNRSKRCFLHSKVKSLVCDYLIQSLNILQDQRGSVSSILHVKNSILYTGILAIKRRSLFMYISSRIQHLSFKLPRH